VADHSQLKHRLRPMRGLRTDKTAQVIIDGHAFMQNLRRGHYELAVDAAGDAGGRCVYRGRALGRCSAVGAGLVAAPWPATRYKDTVGPSGSGQRFSHQCSYPKALLMSARHADPPHRTINISYTTRPVFQQALTHRPRRTTGGSRGSPRIRTVPVPGRDRCAG
jgi:hypothetical protein